MAPAVAQRPGLGQGERFVEQFAAREARGGSAPVWLRALRARGLEAFTAQGFPTTRDEEWRFTPIGAIADTAFVAAELVYVRPEALEDLRFGDATAAELVFVNGVFVPALSRTADLPAGLEVTPLARALAAAPASLEARLGADATPESNPFTALNTALAEDGAIVRVRKGAVVDRPVHLLFYSSVTGAPSASHPRVLVVAEEHSESRIVETYAGPDGQVYLTNAVSEFVVGDRAIVDHYRVQIDGTAAYHVGRQQVRTGRESTFVSHSLVLGGAIARNDICAVLGGAGGDTTLNGLYVGAGTQLLDTHTTIDHALPHNGSHELYKGILGGTARGVFNGKIIVRPDAQKTDAKQTNKALLLSGGAQVNTKPQLEIFADDVKCTHGATVGQLDPEMLFYLRARGIGMEEARGLLIRAFVGDVTARVKFAPLRERLEAWLTARIPREL
jgi:Fe-S cluster assembly protein SufD